MNAVTIRIDPDVAIGRVKPVNGVGQPPMFRALRDWQMFHYLQEAGIPYSRLHDVGGWLGGGLYVDIPNIFRNFNADEKDPTNYRFAFTDSLLKALEAHGVEPYFRLGITIENWVAYPERLPPVNSIPPPDFAKWARICEHVIRHYTEGWADGFKMKITYWEIWNEPENQQFNTLEDSANPMFRAPFSEYMRLYGTVAPYLKAKFPHLKIGGYGHCGFYAGVGSDHIPAANSSPRMEYFVECSRKFLSAARDNGWPLDFFSFHSYSPPHEAMRQVRFADEHLNEYGFTRDKCERHFNEWLPYVGIPNLGSALQAAGVAAELIALQNGSCDLACIYDARCDVGSYSPLFNPLTLKPHKAYHAFTAFNELRKRGTAVEVKSFSHKEHKENKDLVPCEAEILYAAAARGEDGSVAAMVANDSDDAVPFALEIVGAPLSSVAGGASRPSCRMTDADRTDEPAPLPTEMPPHSFMVVVS